MRAPLQLPLFSCATVRELRARGYVADRHGNALLHDEDQELTIDELQAMSMARGAAYLEDQVSEVAA